MSREVGGLLFRAPFNMRRTRRPTSGSRDMVFARREFGYIREPCLRAARSDSRVPPDQIVAAKSGDSRHLVASGALMLMVLALFATSAYAQVRGQLWLDDSPSPSAASLSQAEGQFFAALP